MNLPKNTDVPPLVRLRYGNPFCEDCRGVLQPGWLVAWWKVRHAGGWRTTVLCAACHRDRLRTLKPTEENR